MVTLSDIMLEFYPKEILKIHERVERFEEVKSNWETRKDIWV